MQMQRKTTILALAALVMLLLLGGCGVNRGGSQADGLKARSYKPDGYLGMTNTHPKLPGHHIVTNYASHNGEMKRAIKNVPGVADSNITFNGADAYVTIKLAPGLAAREIPTVEQQAATVLRFNFPRYTIHVKSMK
ncbi:hypothetical protein [Cohnella boryungensis]|jgi:hypothetical protein|uniref:Sporulation protein n=1 Tax=Cohnella boryungensis TaxID=768479 RepID=A0ABV8SHQ4_9BACL